VLSSTKVSVIEHGAWSEGTEEEERKHSVQCITHSLTSAVRGSAPADFDAAFSNAGLAASMLHAELSRRLRRFEAAFESAFPEHSTRR
jgi:hypothetical protein